MSDEVTAKLYEMLTQFAVQSIKSLLLINGGAAIALLAFIGNFIGKDDINIEAFKFTLAILSKALLSFSAGVCLGTLASFSSYICQLLYLETTLYTKANVTRYIAVGFAFLSLLAFALGIGYSYGAFVNLSEKF